MGGVHAPRSSSSLRTPPGCPTSQLGSGTHFPVQCRPRRLRAQPHEPVPTHFRRRPRVVGPRLPTLLSQLPTKLEFSQPPLRFSNLLEWLTELRTIYVGLQFITKDVMKDTDAQPEEEAHGARSRTVPSARASVPVELGVHQPPGRVHQPGSSLDPII